MPPLISDGFRIRSLDLYYDWLDEQDWGPSSELTGAGRFLLMIDMLHELGLPVRNPGS